MEGESPTQASTPAGAVFLSYASQDAEAAKRICEALRAAGIEVWFDQSELRGGDAWDRQIRKQIHDCTLFIPVISANAHARDEGYFRLEWKLAIDRSHLMAPDRTFLLPVVIDNTPQTDERIPDRFRELQWSRLPDGQVPPAFIERVARLLTPDLSSAPGSVRLAASGSGQISAARVAAPRGYKPALWVIGAVAAMAIAYFIADKFWLSKRTVPPPTPQSASAAQETSSGPGAASAFNPPPHSIAVLPFVNMSGDKDQEYFSDGLTEELLNSLARIKELQVSARTSSFSFKGKDTDISTIAHKLNVGSVLEGSVRRSGHMIRVTAQLSNAVTGFHLWSQTYDRDLGDVLKLQTDISNAVAEALKVTLLGDVASKVEIGGTRNPAAFDAYLRGRSTGGFYYGSDRDLLAAMNEASGVDPGNAWAAALHGLSWYLLGDAERGRSSCEVQSAHYEVWVCRAIVYRQLGRAPEAEAELRAIRAGLGDSAAYQYVQIYAQWGDKAKAMEWLEAARRLRDTGLKQLKADPLVDPLRSEAHFRDIQKTLNYPD